MIKPGLLVLSGLMLLCLPGCLGRSGYDTEQFWRQKYYQERLSEAAWERAYRTGDAAMFDPVDPTAPPSSAKVEPVTGAERQAVNRLQHQQGNDAYKRRAEEEAQEEQRWREARDSPDWGMWHEQQWRNRRWDNPYYIPPNLGSSRCKPRDRKVRC